MAGDGRVLCEAGSGCDSDSMFTVADGEVGRGVGDALGLVGRGW